MRKGIPAVLRAHTLLRNRGIPVETIVVSTLSWSPNDYIGPPSESVFAEEKERLSQDGVRFYNGLPNQEILKLMEFCDYFVFPTYHDTFGFVSLEALACGTPVLASNTCAQPEIVEENASGFLLPIENDRRIGRWIWIDKPKDGDYICGYMEQLDTFAKAIADLLEWLWENRKEYERLSSGALERVRKRFNREAAREKLEEIYKQAVGQSAKC